MIFGREKSIQTASDEISRLDVVVKSATVLGRMRDYEKMLQYISEQARILAKADLSALMMVNPRTRDTIKTVFKTGDGESNLELHFLFTNLTGWILKNQDVLLSDHFKKDVRFNNRVFRNSEVHSVLCVPLRVADNIFGTIILVNFEPQKIFTEQTSEILDNFASICAPFILNIQKLGKFFPAPIPENSLIEKYQTFGLYGKSKEFILLLKNIEVASQCDVRVILEGESGTGKERIARAIHHLSSRSSARFVAIDCGALPANLIESELFGHTKGAFTGATRSRKGLMDEANGGTLFLDEISNLPLELQSKLLRVLQEGEIRTVGENSPHAVDIRIIVASSASLQKMVEENQFREDLFYRLHVFPILVPPLDKRREDIHVLANYFLQKFTQKQGKEARYFDGELLDYMKSRHWQGNVRELENFVERLITLTSPEAEVVEADLLPNEYKNEIQKLQLSDMENIQRCSLREKISEFEEKLIRKTLISCNFNQSLAARQLQVSEQVIRYKMKKYSISRPDN